MVTGQGAQPSADVINKIGTTLVDWTQSLQGDWHKMIDWNECDVFSSFLLAAASAALPAATQDEDMF